MDEPKKLKKYFDQYYNNSFYLTSNFCKLYKKCKKDPEKLNEELNEEFTKNNRQYRGFLEMLHAASEKNEKTNQNVCGLIYNAEQEREKLKKLTEQNKSQLQCVQKDIPRVKLKIFPDLCSRILTQYQTAMEDKINFPYCQGDAAVLSAVQVKKNPLQDGLGTKI